MTLFCEKGTFAKETSNVDGTDQTINLANSSLTPKVLWLWTTGQTANATYDTHYMVSYGFSDGTNDACQTMVSEDGVGTSDAGGVIRNDSCLCIQNVNTPTTTEAKADVVSFNAGNFILNWAVSDANATIIHYMVAGGTDITNVKVTQHGVPAAANTGNEAFTGVGFQGDFINIITAGHTGSATQTVNTPSTYSWMSIGAAASSTQRFVVGGVVGHNATNATTAKFNENNRILWSGTNTSLPPSASLVGDFVSFDADGFTLNLVTENIGTVACPFFSLVIKGGAWNCGNGTAPASAGSQSPTTTASILPQGVMMFSTGDITATSGGSAEAEARIAIGGGDSSSHEGCITLHDDSGPTVMVSSRISLTNKVIRAITTNDTASLSTTLAEANLTDMSTAGQFTIDWTTTLSGMNYAWFAASGDAAGTTPVSETSIHKYNMLANVAQTNIHKYNLIQEILRASIHKYDILNMVPPQTSVHKYNLRQNIAQTSIQKYNLLKNILQTSIQKYNLLQQTLQSSIQKYHLLNFTSIANSIHKYNLLKNIAQTSIHKYHLLNTIAQSSIHKYSLLKLIAQTSVHKYNLSAYIAQQSIQKYSLLAYVLQNSIHKYNASGIIAALSIHKYHILNIISQTSKHKYNLLNTIAQSSIHKYTLLNNVLRTSIHKYDLIANVLRASIHKYDLRAYIAQTSIHKYSLLAYIAQTSIHKYHLLVQTLQSSIHKYNILANVLQNSTHKYNVLANILQTSRHKYNILANVLQTSIHKYDLQVLGAVVNALIAKYNISQFISQTNVHKYNLLNNIAQTSIHKYNLLANVLHSSVQKYDVLQNIVNTSLHKYALLQNVILSSIHKYDIIAEALTAIAHSIHKYHLLNSVAQTSKHKYNLLNTVARTSIHKYSLLQQILRTSIHKYNMGGVLVTQSRHVYNIGREIFSSSVAGGVARKRVLKTIKYPVYHVSELERFERRRRLRGTQSVIIPAFTEQINRTVAPFVVTNPITNRVTVRFAINQKEPISFAKKVPLPIQIIAKTARKEANKAKSGHVMQQKAIERYGKRLNKLSKLMKLSLLMQYLDR